MLKKHPAHFLLLSLFLCGYGLLSYYNLLVDDDVVMLRGVQAHGIVGATIDHYNSWNTRWMSFFFLHTWMSFWTETSSLLLYHFCTLLTLFFSCTYVLKALQKKEIVLQESTRSEMNFMSGLLSMAIVLSAFHIGDTWFWVNTSTMYGWNLIILMFALGLAIQPIQNKFLQDTLITLLGLYIGGAGEPAVICLGVLLPLVLYFAPQKSSPFKPHIINFLIGLSVSFGIALAGTGHGKREAALPQLSTMDWLYMSSYFTAKISLFHASLRILLSAILLYPIFSRSKNTTPTFPLLKGSLIAVSLWLLVVLLHSFFITYIMGDYGPPRAWSFIGWMTVFVLACWLYEYGSLIPKMLANIFGWILVPVFVFYVYVQWKELPEYNAYVKKVQSQEIIFEIEKVPSSGLLHSITSGN